MKFVETYGSVKSGKLHIIRSEQFKAQFEAWKDCRVILRVEKVYRRRSIYQNAYYWGVVVPIFCQAYFEATGEQISKEAAHDILKWKCNSRDVVNEKSGEVLRVPVTTRKLTTVQMEEFLQRCRDFLKDFFNVECPCPGEQSTLF